jgi:hypothetical protein
MGRLSWPLLRNFPSLTLMLVKLVQPWLPWKLLLLFPPLKFSLKGIPYQLSWPSTMPTFVPNGPLPLLLPTFFSSFFSWFATKVSRRANLEAHAVANCIVSDRCYGSIPTLFLFFLLYALRVGKTCLDPSLSPFAFSKKRKKKKKETFVSL